MFPRGVITPASPAAANEARALLAPEEERLLESNASTKRSSALTWTLRGLGAVAVVSGVVAVAAIAPGGRDATAAVLARLGGPATVLGRAPAVATVRPEPLPKDAKDEYARKHAHEAKYRSASARARVPAKRSSDDAADTSKSDPDLVEEVDPSDVDVVPDAGSSETHPPHVKRLSYANPQVQHMTEEMRAKDAEIEALKFQLRRQAEELDRRREASGEIDSPTKEASSKEASSKISSASSERRHRSSEKTSEKTSGSSEKKAKAVEISSEEISTGEISAAHHLGGGEPEPERRERSPPEEPMEPVPDDPDYDPATGGEGPPLDDPAQALENCEDVCEGHDFNEAACVSKQGCEWDDGQCWSAVGPNPCDFVEPEAHAHENCELVCEGHNYGLKECVAIRGCEYDGGACWSAVGPHPCDSGPDPIEFPDPPADASSAWAANKPWGDAYGNKWGETYGAENDAGVFEPVADAAEAVTEGVEDAAEAVGDGVEAAGEAVSDGVEAAGDAMEDIGDGISNILPHFGDDEPGSASASRSKASEASEASTATGKLGKDEKADGPYVASAATKYTDGSLENGAVDSAYVPVPTEADLALDEEAKAPYVASATKFSDGTFDGTVDSVYPKVPTEADVPDEDAKTPYVASSTKFSDGTLDGPDQFDPTGVYPTGGYEKSPEEIETEEGRVEARASEADAYKKAYAAAAIEEEAVGDEHTEVAEEDTGYRGNYVAASTKLTDGTYSATLGKHHKYTAAPTVNPYGVKDAEEAAADDADAEEVQEADELESEADAYRKAYAAADAEEQAAGDEHADAADDDGYRGGYVAASTRLTDGTYSKSALGKHHKSAAAAAEEEEEEEEKPKGYQSSYTINPYGVKDPEETDVDEKEEDVPVEKPHGYVASSTRLTGGSTRDDVAAMGAQGVEAAASDDSVDWAHFVAEPTNYHDDPADDEEAELVRKQEAERAAEFEDKEEKERIEAAEKAMSWTAYQSENGKIDHSLEAAEDEAADAAVVDAASDAASDDAYEAESSYEAAAAEDRYESVAEEESASSSSFPSEDAEQEKKPGYRAPATHLTDGSADAAEPASGAPKPHGYVAAATRLTDGSGKKQRPQDQPGYVAPHGYVAAGGRAEANNIQKEAYAEAAEAYGVDDAEEQEAPSGYVAAGGGRL